MGTPPPVSQGRDFLVFTRGRRRQGKAGDEKQQSALLLGRLQMAQTPERIRKKEKLNEAPPASFAFSSVLHTCEHCQQLPGG